MAWWVRVDAIHNGGHLPVDGLMRLLFLREFLPGLERRVLEVEGSDGPLPPCFVRIKNQVSVEPLFMLLLDSLIEYSIVLHILVILHIVYE